MKQRRIHCRHPHLVQSLDRGHGGVLAARVFLVRVALREVLSLGRGVLLVEVRHVARLGHRVVEHLRGVVVRVARLEPPHREGLVFVLRVHEGVSEHRVAEVFACAYI